MQASDRGCLCIFVRAEFSFAILWDGSRSGKTNAVSTRSSPESFGLQAMQMVSSSPPIALPLRSIMPTKDSRMSMYTSLRVYRTWAGRHGRGEICGGGAAAAFDRLA